MVSYLRKGGTGPSYGEVAEWFNVAGFKKEKKSVSSVILASEVQVLPSPLQILKQPLDAIGAGQSQAKAGRSLGKGVPGRPTRLTSTGLAENSPGKHQPGNSYRAYGL